MAFRPPAFHGGTDAAAAENWMISIEKHLRSIGCADDRRVQLSTFLFRGDAERWWETTRQRFAWVKEQKVYEFVQLVQGTNTVAQYKAEFTTLSRYTPDLVSTEAKKAAKFQRGLRANIRHTFGGALSVDYATVVQRAYTIEWDRNEWRATQAAKKGTSTSQGSSNNKKKKWTVGQGNKIENNPQCGQCGRKHGGSCLARKNVCSQYGQEGHRKKDCLRNQAALPAPEVTCFRCRQKGHIANRCTQSPQNRGQQVNQRPPVARGPRAPIPAVPVA
ncbi:uncharacterized protein LOC127787543 [Diospyros lotus]|uniref:uncharacterized protein LOC127787543 n=1 Tax=Diospyros lotus TaxID=55363 RepID=UPI0022585D4A|nr:uncharacterized protein LOC127787543 [Diospyros lotus]